MILLKGCGRCGGPTLSGDDEAGQHTRCLVCSQIKYLLKERTIPVKPQAMSHGNPAHFSAVVR